MEAPACAGSSCLLVPWGEALAGTQLLVWCLLPVWLPALLWGAVPFSQFLLGVELKVTAVQWK